jgi:hypothetical protein
MFYLQLTIGLEMEKVAEVVSVTFFYAPTSTHFLFESDKLPIFFSFPESRFPIK